MPPGFTGKQKDIVEALMRGESVDEIVLRLDTTPAYIYNVRSDAKQLGLTLGPPRNPTRDDNQQREQPQPHLNTGNGLEHLTPNVPAVIVREPDAIIYPGDRPNATDMAVIRQIQSNPLLRQFTQQWHIQQQPPAPPPNRNFLEETLSMMLKTAEYAVSNKDVSKRLRAIFSN